VIWGKMQHSFALLTREKIDKKTAILNVIVTTIAGFPLSSSVKYV
jgi:hypothetical protein